MFEHAVMVHLSIGDSHFGTEQTRAAVRALERADNLFAAIEPPLRRSSLRPAYAILRYGDASDPTAQEHRIEV